MFPSVPLLHLILVALTAHIALAGVRITTSLYALSMHASEFTVGILIALFSLFPMLGAVAAGRLIDRIGILRPMMAGSIAMALGCALPGIVDGLPVLFLATMLIGTGFMVIQVAAQHMVGAASAAEQRASNYSWLALGFSVSGFTGPVLAGLIIDDAPYFTAYLVFAGVAAAAFVLVASGKLSEIHLHRPARHTETGKALDLLRLPEMRHIFIVGMLLSSAWDLFTFVLPIHGARSGFAASTIGFILGCFSTATFLVRLAMPLIARRLSEWQVLTGALVLAALCYAVFPFVRQPLSLMVVAAILGLAVGSAQPNMLALLHHVAPSGRAGEAVGIRVTIGNACQVFLPLAFGGAGAALGLPVVFWSMTAMICAGLPIAWRKTRLSKAE
ncbi:MFS transporter [Noviherbaspirillum sp.]|uniref:MFS transporter n=1 Tax=Noviherbaspirillum sp. TaxID=1926288 RepID=UPI002D63B552|nr:MFS transporter [Noviherbaspirillum sp.]HZW21501.1 MFS transporter [Noviherbaspirillum sp.]